MSKNCRALSMGLIVLAFLSASLFILLNTYPSLADTDKPADATAPKASVSTTASTSASSSLLAAPAASKIDVAAAMQDHYLGDEKAPVTIIEYASLTCPHCAHFDTTILPDVKKKLLDTGKAKLIFRDFPLDGVALKAAMMTHCVSPLQYYNMVDVIFTKQEFWTKAKDPMEELEKLGSLAGLNAADFKSCTENKDLETAILAVRKNAMDKYNVDSTPNFIFNDGAEKFAGAQPVEKFEEIVNKLSKGK
jgi:protein-disulfide isomerase